MVRNDLGYEPAEQEIEKWSAKFRDEHFGLVHCFYLACPNLTPSFVSAFVTSCAPTVILLFTDVQTQVCMRPIPRPYPQTVWCRSLVQGLRGYIFNKHLRCSSFRWSKNYAVRKASLTKCAITQPTFVKRKVHFIDYSYFIVSTYPQKVKLCWEIYIHRKTYSKIPMRNSSMDWKCLMS